MNPAQTRGRLSGGIASVVALVAARLIVSFSQSQSRGLAATSVALWVVIALVALTLVLVEIVTASALIRAHALRKRYPGEPVYFAYGAADLLRAMLAVDPQMTLRGRRYFALVVSPSGVSVWVGATRPVTMTEFPASQITAVRARDSRTMRSARGQVILDVTVDGRTIVVPIKLVHVTLLGDFSLDYVDCLHFESLVEQVRTTYLN